MVEQLEGEQVLTETPFSIEFCHRENCQGGKLLFLGGEDAIMVREGSVCGSVVVLCEGCQVTERLHYDVTGDGPNASDVLKAIEEYNNLLD